VRLQVLSKITSPFCVSLNYAYQDDVSVMLVLTLMAGGDLHFLLKGRYKKKDFTPLPEESVKFYIASMALGLEAIHKAGYVYRDLKPMNVLLDQEGQVRLSDMGLTADISKGPIKQCSGTRGYWSPETIKKEPYTTEPDWWSLGVTAYVLTSDKMPFKGGDDAEKDAATCAGTIEFAHGESDALQGIVKSLCVVDKDARLKGVDALKAHPYFSGFNWAGVENGTYDPEIKPNPNDINAPSKNEIEAFKKPKDVDWTSEDQAKFADWEFMNKDAWMDEAIFRIKKKKEIKGSGGGGGGGCCTIA
jgi:serine/threonine kinase 32